MTSIQHSLNLIFCCYTRFLAVKSDWKVGVKHYYSDLPALTNTFHFAVDQMPALEALQWKMKAAFFRSAKASVHLWNSMRAQSA